VVHSVMLVDFLYARMLVIVYSVLAVAGDSLHEMHGIFCWHHECAYCVATEARTTMVALWVLHWLSSSAAGMKLGHMIRHMKWQVWCLVPFFNMFTSDAFLLLKGSLNLAPQKLQGCCIFCLRGHGWFFQPKAWHPVHPPPWFVWHWGF
jgi:hypothetical protein